MKTLALVLLLLAPTAIIAQDNFSVIYETPRMAEKKVLWQALSKDEQIEVRRENFAWGIQYLELSKDQSDYLDRFSNALPTITKDEAGAFETEALELFTYKEGALLFGSVGPFKSCRKEIVFIPNLQTSCPCSVGSSFNMSCSGECTAANNRCIVAGDGCGFAWLYSCNGLCQLG